MGNLLQLQRQSFNTCQKSVREDNARFSHPYIFVGGKVPVLAIAPEISCL